jgi:hypothetical protein
MLNLLVFGLWVYFTVKAVSKYFWWRNQIHNYEDKPINELLLHRISKLKSQLADDSNEVIEKAVSDLIPPRNLTTTRNTSAKVIQFSNYR